MKRKTVSLLFATLLITGLSNGEVATQENAAAPDSLSETYGSWVVSCGAGLTGCHVFQALYRAKDKARLMQVTVFPPAEGAETPELRALVPLGATIAEGAVLQIDDGAPEVVAFQACWPRGCIASLPLTQDLEARLRQGETLAVAVQGADTGRTLRFVVALDGVAAALDRLREL